MAREIKIKDIAGLMEDEIQEMSMLMQTNGFAEVKKLTPVDTGVLVNGWQIEAGKISRRGYQQR
jgi:hypothetical protein